MQQALQEPPRYRHTVPLFGSALEYGRHGPTFLKKLRYQYGDTFSFKLLRRWVTVSFRMVKQILQTYTALTRQPELPR